MIDVVVLNFVGKFMCSMHEFIFFMIFGRLQLFALFFLDFSREENQTVGEIT